MATIVVCFGLLAVSASAADAAPIWNVESEAMPTAFQSSDGAGNDGYEISLQNLGTSASQGPVRLVDQLPAGVSTTASPAFLTGAGSSGWVCSEGAGQTVVECTTTSALPQASGAYDVTLTASPFSIAPIEIPVTVAGGAPAQIATNTVTVSGGGAANPATVSTNNPINDGAVSTFGASFLQFHAIGANGEPFSVAGGHPWAVTTAFQFNQELNPGATNTAVEHTEEYRNVSAKEEPKTIVADLPLGLIGNPQATPRCTLAEFSEGINGDNINGCPADTRVGIVYKQKSGGLEQPYQVFNLVPAAGHAAEFGFTYASVPITFFGDVVNSSRGYTLRITALVPQAFIRGLVLVFFGDPAVAFETGRPDTPFLSSPVDCAASEAERTLQLHVDTWTHPGIGDPFSADFSDSDWIPASGTLPPVEGCGALAFNPSLSFQPATATEGGTSQADQPSGYNVNLQVPQTEHYSELATPEPKTVTVTLPVGVSISPSAAGGLEACSGAQFSAESNEPGACPLGSQIATAKLSTPLLESPVEGRVFIGTPQCGADGVCTDGDASSGHIFRLFLELHSQALGLTIKLSGTVKANPVTGQLTAQFAENPQLPFNKLELKFKNGPRAPLANPQTCGTFTTVSNLEPWSAPGTPTAVSESPFAISGCGASLSFNPGFSAGAASQAAGGTSDFSVSVARNDGEQNLSRISVTTPPGLLGEIAGIPRCGEAEANEGSCSSASQIGDTTASAGPGSNPYTVTGGRVYLTGPYNGQPFGLSIVVPAVAGPFNLGNVIVRASIAVDPSTAQLTVVSTPLPQIVDGVPVRLRTVNVQINRPSFILNATSCNQQSITATISGEHPIGSGAPAKTSTASTPYTPSGCANLPFKPRLTATAGGKGTKATGSSLDVKLESAGLGQANIAKVDLRLPKALSTRDSTLNKACAQAQFALNPSGCPEGSVIGKATINTPLLSAALTGPAYLVSHGGAAFPDVEIVLQGEGVTLVLDGKTDIKKGITYSNFESTPDAPFTTFETELPTGPHSIFTANVPANANYSLCGTSLSMPTRIVGQNGAAIEQTTKISVIGCTVARPLTRAQKLANALRQCRRDKKKKKRKACEATARKRYGHIVKKKSSGKTSHGKGRR